MFIKFVLNLKYLVIISAVKQPLGSPLERSLRSDVFMAVHTQDTRVSAFSPAENRRGVLSVRRGSLSAGFFFLPPGISGENMTVLLNTLRR